MVPQRRGGISLTCLEVYGICEKLNNWSVWTGPPILGEDCSVLWCHLPLCCLVRPCSRLDLMQTKAMRVPSFLLPFVAKTAYHQHRSSHRHESGRVLRRWLLSRLSRRYTVGMFY